MSKNKNIRHAIIIIIIFFFNINRLDDFRVTSHLYYTRTRKQALVVIVTVAVVDYCSVLTRLTTIINDRLPIRPDPPSAITRLNNIVFLFGLVETQQL